MIAIVNQQKKAFDQLVEFEKRGTLISLIVDSSELAIKVRTLEGVITSWNRGAEIIYGYTKTEIIGKNISLLIPPSLGNDLDAPIKQISEGNSILDYETKRIRKDGVIIDVSISFSPIRDDAGKVIGMVTLDRNITELISAANELDYQDSEREKRAAELIIANRELVFQSKEKEKRAAELIVANKELVFQSEEKEKRAAELIVANKELVFQNGEKEKRANELVEANKELIFQNKEKEKRADELTSANQELKFKSKENEKRKIINKELEASSSAIKQISEYSRSLIEASSDPLVTISPDGKITDVNEALIKVTGEPREKLIGTEFSSYFTEPEKAQEGYKSVFEKSSVSDYPLTIRHKNGKLTSVLYNATVYKNEKGNVLGVFAAARDVTAIKHASQYARSLIEASRDPLFAISTEGVIIDVNEATINATHKTRDKIIGTYFIDYVTEPEQALIAYQKIFEDGFISNYPLIINDGTNTSVLCNGSVYKDDTGNVLGAVIVARDVTEQNRIATELIEAKVFAELATVIAEEEKSKAQAARTIAEESVKAKQQFLSNMSHEIRTPMNAIIGFTKVVLRTNLTLKQKEYLSAIKLSGDSLIVLINDILDLAKVDSGKMTFEQIPFKIASSVSAMLHLFETKIYEKNVKLIKEYDASIPEVLIGDPVRLHQIILNLVGNSVKFTANGSITIKVQLVNEDEENVAVKFSIIDTGIGIEENKIKRIFEKFHQATSDTSRLYGGTGLGLAIVKQLVESQGGTIGVESTEDVGSTFSFTLNFKKTQASAELESEEMDLDQKIKNLNVLVVEDIALNQLLMKTLLDDFEFNCDIAANGKIAIEKLKLKAYDIILMDLQMPEMNGFEATDYIRKNISSTIPIIALTADVTTVDVTKCKAIGMDDYIAKPVDEKLLYVKMLNLVNKTTILEQEETIIETYKISRCIDLAYLIRCTKSDPKLMMELMATYLKQTPPLINAMKQGYKDEDWNSLYSAVHKMIPSFSIVGLSVEFENMAKKIQEHASTKLQSDEIHDMIIQLENVCNQACIELQEEIDLIKNGKNAKI